MILGVPRKRAAVDAENRQDRRRSEQINFFLILFILGIIHVPLSLKLQDPLLDSRSSGAVDFSNAHAHDVVMGHHVLTLLFVLVTLMGPGRCCCLASPAKAASPSTTPVPVKSCCQVQMPSKQTPAEPKQAPVKKCPCEQNHHDVASTLASESSAGGELVSLLKWIDQASNLVATSDRSPIATTSTTAPLVVRKLSGRSLLAVYSILRC